MTATGAYTPPVNLHRVDDRELTWCEVGDPSGDAVIHLHGANSSRLEIARLDEAARAAGVRLICFDRPGYGGSTDRRLDTPGSLAGDTAALADALGIDGFVISGLSAGGMYALAIAHALGKRVSRVIAINTAPPLTDAVIGRAAPWQLRLVAGLAARAPGITGWLLKRQGPRQVETPTQTIARIRRQSPADADMFAEDPVSLEFSLSAARVGKTQDSSAPTRDFALAGTRWGFDPRMLSCEVVIVNGTRDPLRGAGEALAREIPGSSYVEMPGGHVLVYRLQALTELAQLMATGVTGR